MKIDSKLILVSGAIAISMLSGCVAKEEALVVVLSEQESESPKVSTGASASKTSTSTSTSKVATAKPARLVSDRCLSILDAFRRVGVDVSDLNSILANGLTKGDFIGKSNNEAFELLAVGRSEGCKYPESYLK